MSNRFDLEQEIMSCWDVVQDLNFYIKNFDYWSEDERVNYLVGLKVKYDKKFEVMFNTFEQYIASQHKEQSGKIRGLTPIEFSQDELNNGYPVWPKN